MLGALGDLVEDVVVRLGGPMQVASDTAATVTRRPGGSAANVAMTAAGLAGRSRFIGQVGDDALGSLLIDAMTAGGVEVAGHRGGRTGTIVVLVDERGERTMLPDRGCSTELADPDLAWIDGLHTLHVPFYSLAVDPLATTAGVLIGEAHGRGATVSIDLSSASVLRGFGIERAVERLRRLAPDVVLANGDEAACLGPERLAAVEPPVVVVKRGPQPARVVVPGRPPVEVPALDLGPVADSTGAGDAFAAGFLLARADGADPVEATRAGHAAAAARLRAEPTDITAGPPF